MQRAIQLAELSGGQNAPNPKVGAVIVYKDRIIGEGWHQQYGEAHAEVNAVNSVRAAHRDFLQQATIYVTLEPCFHYGKTPPCVDLILAHKIPRVVISCIDPFESVIGQSIQKLRDAGVEVLTGVLRKEGEQVTRRFFTNVQKERPYVVLKYAVSADGFIGKKGEVVPISNKISKRLVHKWRSEEMAILVGTTTAQVDNPRLDNRHYFGKPPIRLVIDKALRIDSNRFLFNQEQPTWVFTAKEKADDGIVRYVILDFEKPLVAQILNYLQEQRVQSLLVEGGAVVLQQFIDAQLWDECRVLKSKSYLYDGVKGPQLKNAKLLEECKLLDNNLLFFVPSETE